MNKKIIKYPICKSTNETIKKIKEKKIIIISDFQYNGKGKLNNIWESGPYKNLTFSILLEPNFTIKKIFNMNIIILTSIKKTLSKYINEKKIKIKWPNDIYYNKKKIAGILIENIIKKKKIKISIIGIGLNINQKKFKNAKATSILIITKKKINISIIMFIILKNIKKKYKKIIKKKTKKNKKKYNKNLYWKNEINKFKKKNNCLKKIIQNEKKNFFIKINK